MISQKGILFILGAILTSVVNYPLIKYSYILTPELTSIDFMLWGFGGTAIVSSLVILNLQKYRSEVKKQILNNYKLHLFLASISTFACYLFFEVVQNVDIGLLSVLTKSDVLLSILFGVIFLKEKISPKNCLLITIVVIGFLLLSTLKGEITYYYLALIIISRLCYAIQSLFVKKYAGSLNTIAFTYIRSTLIAIMSGIICIAFFDVQYFSIYPLFIMIISQVFGILIYRIFYFEAHKYMHIGFIPLFLLLVPIFILIISNIFFNESLSIQKIIGVSCVILGLFFIYWNSSKAKQTSK